MGDVAQQQPGFRAANGEHVMDWVLIGFTIAGSWVVLLVAGDLASLLNISQKRQAMARNVAFFFAVALTISLGVPLAGGHHTKPCTTKGALR